ncbi:MAG TPA: hypothetical protein VG502_16220 [Flexivirga sp.]|uniref:hypothetical protein n=1 Tax=Flexivirga sp. TaxID=1962927 RepID=UPI002B570577|nr:hypothetical protein [Flexivirga sp.]HWC23842.1 hypothetical protein [Flexivirga sp.]
MTERTFQSGWFALYPDNTPRLAYAEMTVRVGHSARAEISWEQPGTDSGVYNGIDLRYMRSRASVATFMCLDPFDSWSREDTVTLPTDLRARMRDLVDGADSDLNELFSILAAQDPAMIAAIDSSDVVDEVAAGPDLPASDNVWRAAPDTSVQSIRPWWQSRDRAENEPDDDLAELAKISPEAAAIARRMGNTRPMS